MTDADTDLVPDWDMVEAVIELWGLKNGEPREVIRRVTKLKQDYRRTGVFPEGWEGCTKRVKRR